MLILAIDTALDACAAAVLDAGAGKLLSRHSVTMTRGHAEAVMPLIARVMSEASVPFSSLDRIAVTTGPGSFTGLRVGISAARGIGLAAGRPVIGVTTLWAYAAPLLRAHGGQVAGQVIGQVGGHVTGRVIVTAIDARHDQVYLQAVGGDGRVLIEPKVATVTEALEAARFGAPHLVGNAAALLAARWSPDAPPPVGVDAASAPDIACVAWLGAAADPAASPARPFYLRPADAKPAQTHAGLPHRPPQPAGAP